MQSIQRALLTLIALGHIGAIVPGTPSASCDRPSAVAPSGALQRLVALGRARDSAVGAIEPDQAAP